MLGFIKNKHIIELNLINSDPEGDPWGTPVNTLDHSLNGFSIFKCRNLSSK